MSLKDFRGSAYAYARLMQVAADDIKNGTAKPARVLFKGPNRAKVSIGLFAARVLRMKRRSA